MAFFQTESPITDGAGSTSLVSPVTCDRQNRESHVESAACTTRAPRETDAVEARMQYEEPGQEREENWRRSLHSLQEWICELLIKNQELRMSLLNSTITHQSGEVDQ